MSAMNKMPREMSIYLDLVRFTAALMVFINHTSGQRITGGLLWQLGESGPEAVTVFFVLSGFVIAHATATRETSAPSYMVARMARMYSVALPSLVATFVFDCIGRSGSQELYSATYHFASDGVLWQYLSALLFVDQIWGMNLVPGSNWSYWSLGYEVWYYVIFGLALFAPRRWRVVSVLAALVFVGPNVVVMFPLWLLGVGCQRLVSRVQLNRAVSALLCFGSLICWAGYEWWAAKHGRLVLPITPLFPRDLLPQDYLIGVLFAAHLVGFANISSVFSSLLQLVSRPVRWLAGATFTLYLFHEPIVRMLASNMPWPPASWASRTIILGGTLALVFLIAQVTERRKEAWRRSIEAIASHALRLKLVRS